MSSSKPRTAPSAHPSSSASASPCAVRNARSRAAVLGYIVAIRLFNAWCISTFFQPDEFFQALEPAWRLAFGPQSRAWLTWEWHRQLRSSLHPALFSLAYLLADKFSLLLPRALRTATIMAAPRVLQALVAALGDWHTWQLAVDVYSPDANCSNVVLLLQLLSPWQWYVSTRTFSNSLETTLTAMALCYWPWQLGAAAVPAKENPRPPNPLTSSGRLRVSLCLAALAVLLRPTNVLIWAAVVGVTLTRLLPSPLTRSRVVGLFRYAVLCGGLVVSVSLVSDRLYFGFWTFPPLNWLNFNISKSLAVFYGRNPWHYYLLQGIPLLCTTSLPFAFWGLVRPLASSTAQEDTLRILSLTVFTTVGALSLISHKEVRFIYPLLPALNILAAPWAASFFTSPSLPSSKPLRPRLRLRNTPFLYAGLAINFCLAAYLSLFHQAAPLAVLSHLRSQYERIHPASSALAAHATPRGPHELFVLFLTPCHSTPWRSHLVYPGLDAYALSCEPPLHTEPGSPERAAYRDEADRFYDDPQGFLRAELFRPGGLRAPRYIVGFEGIEPWLHRFLETDEAAAIGLRRLDQVWSGFNGLFSDDWRRAGRLLVWDTGVYGDAPASSEVGA